MTRQRFEVFTYRSGDTVFSTRFRSVARLVARYVRTLDCLPAGSLRGTALAAGLVPPEGMEATLADTHWAWWPVGTEKALGVTLCRYCSSPAMLLTDRFEPVCASHYYDCPIPLVPTEQAFETVTKTPTGWACTCGEANCPHILPWAALEPCACSSVGAGTNPCPREDECHANWLAKRAAERP